MIPGEEIVRVPSLPRNVTPLYTFFWLLVLAIAVVVAGGGCVLVRLENNRLLAALAMSMGLQYCRKIATVPYRTVPYRTLITDTIGNKARSCK